MSMIFLRGNDPFHFGTVSRALFSVIRMETLDSWDQILYIALYGCDEYPAGYDFTFRAPGLRCTEPYALGYGGVAIMLGIIVFGAFILPTVLIGIVSVSFEEATRQAHEDEEFYSKMKEISRYNETNLPGFFSKPRLDMLKEVFQAAARGLPTADMEDTIPVYAFVLHHLFWIRPSRKELELLYQIIDSDGDAMMGAAEFVLFVGVAKVIEAKCKRDPGYASRIFGDMPHKFEAKMRIYWDGDGETKDAQADVGPAALETPEEQLERITATAPVIQKTIDESCSAIARRFLLPAFSNPEREEGCWDRPSKRYWPFTPN